MSALWYAVFTKPRKEIQVHDYLRSHGVMAYHPIITVKPVNPRSSTIRSFFPRYLFIYANLAETGFSLVQWVPGAVGLVTFGGEPSSIPESFIVELRRQVAAFEKAGGPPRNTLKKGDAVTITEGAFAGYEGLFDVYLSGEQRVQVLLKWMGRQTKLSLDASGVELRRPREQGKR